MDSGEELISRERVLDDMFSDRGPITWAARTYFYEHYATAEQKRMMDKEDARQELLRNVIWGTIIVLAVILPIYFWL